MFDLRSKLYMAIALTGIASIIFYLFGIVPNWLVVGYFFVGYYSLSYLLSRVSSGIKDNTKKMSGELFWYTGSFLEAVALAIIFGQSTLVDMYQAWAVETRSIYGFIRIFAPIILVTISSVWLAYESKDRKWSRRLMKLGLVMGLVALIFHEPIQSLDRYASVWKIKFSEVKDVETMTTKRNSGVFAIFVKSSHCYSYNGSEFIKAEGIEKNAQFPLYKRNSYHNNGPYKMVQIWWKDENGSFSNRSSKRWVKMLDIKFVTHYKTKKPKKEVKPRRKKVNTYQVGRYVFNLGAGESTDFIKFPIGTNLEYFIKSKTPDANFTVHYKDGTVYSSREADKKRFPVFYIKAQESQKIILTVKGAR